MPIVLSSPIQSSLLLPTPPAPTLAVIGTPGTAVLTYFAVYTNALGQDSAPSPPTTITNAPNALSAVNYISVTVPIVPGAVAGKILKGNTATFVGTMGGYITGDFLGVDQGGATSTYLASFFNPAAWSPVLPIGSDHAVVAGPGVAGNGVTATLNAVLGFTHSITKLNIYRFAAAALTAAAVPVQVTTTNLNGMIFPMPADASAQGLIYQQDFSPGVSPMRGVAQNTNTTIVCPATPNVIWTILVLFYYSS